jgi:hypothetical protein
VVINLVEEIGAEQEDMEAVECTDYWAWLNLKYSLWLLSISLFNMSFILCLCQYSTEHWKIVGLLFLFLYIKCYTDGEG